VAGIPESSRGAGEVFLVLIDVTHQRSVLPPSVQRSVLRLVPMAKDMLKSLAIGLFVTVVLLALAIIGTHTILEAITLPFTAPFAVLAAVASHEIMKGQAGAKWETISLYGFMVLFGSLLYGLVAFSVLRYKSRKRPKAS